MSNTQQVARKHHYIPEFYLKKWHHKNNKKNDDLKLVQYRKTQSGVKYNFKTSAETAYGINLYSREDLPDNLRDALEKITMSQIDSDASLIHEMLLNGIIPRTSEERTKWVRFIISLIYRNPEKIGDLSCSYKKNMELVSEDIKKYYDIYKGVDDPKNYDEYEKTVNKYQDGYDFCSFFENLIVGANEIGSHFVKMYWKVVEADKHYLLTSDRPLQGSNGFVFGNRFLREDGHFCIALSPEKLFMATNTYDFMNYLLKPSNRIFNNFNRLITNNCKRFVYSRDLGQDYFIKKNFSGINPITLGLPDHLSFDQELKRFHEKQSQHMRITKRKGIQSH